VPPLLRLSIVSPLFTLCTIIAIAAIIYFRHFRHIFADTLYAIAYLRFHAFAAAAIMPL
jgi:hypothetical protein